MQQREARKLESKEKAGKGTKVKEKVKKALLIVLLILSTVIAALLIARYERF